MPRFILVPVLFLFGFLAWGEQTIVVVDDAGRELVRSAPAQRIVSLAPHVTELLFAAGAGPGVVGVSEFSTYPPQAQRLPRVGSGVGLDLEAIAALRPDLIVAWQSGNSAGQLEKLQRLGFAIFYSEPTRIEDIATNLERLGRLAGSGTQARRQAQLFRRGVEVLRERYAGHRRIRAFYQIWPRPLMTISGAHIISDWLKLCGAENIFSDLSDLAPVIDVEAVLAGNPQVIIAGRYPGKGDDWKSQWQRWTQLSAVRDGHLYTVPAETMERQSPRALQAARELCEKIDQVRVPDY